MNMRKFLTLLAVTVTILCGCGVQNDQKGLPTETVKGFNKYIKEEKINEAYSMFSQRIKKKLKLEDFTKTVKPEKKDPKLNYDAMKNIELVFDKEEIIGQRAFVYGTVKMEAGISNIRTKCLLENNVWKIDSEVIEDQSPDDKSFYRDIDLHKISTQYCEAMLKGDAKNMYEMSSSSIRNKYNLEIFKEETTATGSENTPEKEGFRIKAEYAYSDDNGNGKCFMTIGNMSGNKELESGILFKLPWVLESGVWKANFARIDDTYKMKKVSQ